MFDPRLGHKIPRNMLIVKRYFFNRERFGERLLDVQKCFNSQALSNRVRGEGLAPNKIYFTVILVTVISPQSVTIAYL